MLKALTIRDLAIVRTLDVEFFEGLTVITGETGAGKSILVDALGLCLGDRADSAAVRNGAERAVVTALFDLGARPELATLLRQHDIDVDDECVLRRVVGSDGRSRAFCNETPVAVQFLKDFGANLVGIHGQHAHHSLLERPAQRTLLDAYGQLAILVGSVATAHRELRAVEDELSALRGGYQDAASRLEFLRFQLDELAELPLEPEALAALEAQHRKTANLERLRAGCVEIETRLAGEPRGVRKGINQALHLAGELAGIDPQAGPLLDLLQQAAINLDEAEHELDRYAGRLSADGGALERLDATLTELHAAARKHRCEPSELGALRQRLTDEHARLVNHAAVEQALGDKLAAAAETYGTRAGQLTAARAKAAAALDRAVTAHLHEMSLPHARFVSQITPASAPGEHGADEIDFLISANPDQPPRPLRKVASGGELSRISLAIQVATAGVSGVPLLVYDEVDSGVSGRVAAVLARLLRAIAKGRQVLCITHMPQVAAAGDGHLLIGKEVLEGATRTQVAYLSAEGRVGEVARMLAGEQLTDKTLAHARELLAG